MSKGTFTKIGESTEPMYGPRAILACGFTQLEQEKLMKALDIIQLTDLPVTFATAADTGKLWMNYSPGRINPDETKTQILPGL